MKAKLHRNLLELALNRCFDACERKQAESLTTFHFDLDSLKLSTKGGFTYLETVVKDISCDQECFFTLKTSAILEFVKYISSEEIYLIFDNEKKSCLVSSSDKKSKLAFQAVDENYEEIKQDTYDLDFVLEDSNQFLDKLSNASKFCSNDFQDHPLTGIHCYIKDDCFSVQATSGAVFFKDMLSLKTNKNFEFYLPKKSPSILKSIFFNSTMRNFSVNKNHFLVQTDNSKLKIYLENSEQNSFPSQITDWLDKKSTCSVKVSTYEFVKTLRYLNGILPNSIGKFSCLNDIFTIEASQSHFAAKENVIVENVKGEITENYNIKCLIDCLDSIDSAWVNVEFCSMQDDFNLCKITSGQTVCLLCPDIS